MATKHTPKQIPESQLFLQQISQMKGLVNNPLVILFTEPGDPNFYMEDLLKVADLIHVSYNYLIRRVVNELSSHEGLYTMNQDTFNITLLLTRTIMEIPLYNLGATEKSTGNILSLAAYRGKNLVKAMTYLYSDEYIQQYVMFNEE